MTRLVFVVTGAAVLVALFAVAQLREARADLARARAELAGQAEAERYRQKERERAAEAAVVDRELQEGVGSDAALSDYLRGGAGRVWP